MDGDAGPTDARRHGLGPHVIGQRVVVRRLLRGETGPTGGPAFTDVLGVCESWADGRALLRREDGSTVEIATADIVSGKPVPPRPSVRGRVSVRDAESHAAPLWPGVVREALGEWELRTEPSPVGRPLKRTGSCLAVGDPGRPLPAAAEAVVAFYRLRDRTPMVQVEAGSAQERWFTAAGWVGVPGDASYLLGSLARARRLLRPPGVDAVLTVAFDGPRVTVRATRGDETLGGVEGALDGDWLGVHGLVVDPAHRRRGVASALLAALLEAGAERGATTVWLHVETDNAPALALYDGLGLVVHHSLRYLTPA